MTKRTLFIAVPIVAIVLNGVGYLIVTKLRAPSRTSAVDVNGGRDLPVGQTAPAKAVTDDQKGGNVDGAKALPEALSGAQDAEDAKARAERGMALKAAGLTALEAGEYQKALKNFSEAKGLLGDKAHVDELLQVAEDLRVRPQSQSRTRNGASSGQSAPRGRGGGSRRVSAKDDAPVEAAAPPASAPSSSASGLLIVTTTPRGMLVQVDETAVDLTPMRTKVTPGSHRIALLDGDRKVYETTIDVKDGATATLLKDLSSDRGIEASRPAATTAGSAANAKENSARLVPGTILPPPPPPAEPSLVRAPLAPAVASPSTSASSGTGTLEVSSPGLYGIVWINGRPRGYPPLVVRDLPIGATKVEVRVNGIQKRAVTAVVKAGVSTSIKVRSAESNP